MNEEDINEFELDHFIYGSYNGYKIKSYSSNIDVDFYSNNFSKFFLPIRQSQIKYIKDMRSIISVNRDFLLISRLFKGGLDNYGRGTIANHLVVVPKEKLREDLLDYHSISEAMIKFEEQNLNILGMMPYLIIPKSNGFKYRIESLMTRDAMERIINIFERNTQAKIFIYCPDNNYNDRIDIAYNISIFFDINLNQNLRIITEEPIKDDMNFFNMIISDHKIRITPNEGWEFIRNDYSNTNRNTLSEKANQLIKKIYKK